MNRRFTSQNIRRIPLFCPFFIEFDYEFFLLPLVHEGFQNCIPFSIQDNGWVHVVSCYGGLSLLGSRGSIPRFHVIENFAQAQTKVSRELQVFDVASRVDVRAVVGLAEKLAVQVRLIFNYVTFLRANQGSWSECRPPGHDHTGVYVLGISFWAP